MEKVSGSSKLLGEWLHRSLSFCPTHRRNADSLAGQFVFIPPIGWKYTPPFFMWRFPFLICNSIGLIVGRKYLYVKVDMRQTLSTVQTLSLIFTSSARLNRKIL
jgi:hypothetical protein